MRQKSTFDATGLVKKGQVITENFTKSEGHKTPVTIKKGFFIYIPNPSASDIKYNN